MANIFTYFRSAPKFSVWISHPGKKSRVLITAGVDGDELSGIAAANSLIKTYNLDIPITVIPVVNLAGYEAGTSLNPLDGRFPKHLYPGSPFGSSSARLMNSLSHLASEVELWIDLHGGSTTEHLKPFIWSPAIYPVLTHLQARVLVEKSIFKGMPYLMLESGELGKVEAKTTKTHLDWISQIFTNLDSPALSSWQPTYTKVKYEKLTGQPISENILWWSASEFVTAG